MELAIDIYINDIYIYHKYTLYVLLPEARNTVHILPPEFSNQTQESNIEAISMDSMAA